jgi:PadR family transcriptional regulator PadR
VNCRQQSSIRRTVSTSAAGLSSAIRQPVSLSTGETLGGNPSCTAVSSVPPSESASEIVIVISPRIAGSVASNSSTSTICSFGPELTYLWTFQRRPAILFAMAKGKGDINKKSEVLQGTLDLMILKTLQAMGPLHGFGIARRLEQLSEEVLRLNEGTVYTSLLRLLQEGWIAAEWGASENNRKAKFYSITRRGLKQLARGTEDWERISGVIDRLLRLEGQR